MDKWNVARILQNMIEEAQENLDKIDDALTPEQRCSADNRAVCKLAKRRDELKEAMALVAPLDPEHYQEGAGMTNQAQEIKRLESLLAARRQGSAEPAKTKWVFDRYRPNIGKMAEGAETYAITEEEALAKVAARYTDSEDIGTYFVLIECSKEIDRASYIQTNEVKEEE